MRHDREPVNFNDEEYERLKQVVNDAAEEAAEDVDLVEELHRVEKEENKRKAELAAHRPTQATKDRVIKDMAVAPNLQEGGSAAKNKRTSGVTIYEFFSPSHAKDQSAAPPSPHHA